MIRMFFAIWYDLRDEWFDFEDGAYLTLSSGGGKYSYLSLSFPFSL